MPDTHAKRWEEDEPMSANEPLAAEPRHPEQRRSTPQRVVVVDFDMSFDSMVMFMVKAAIAAIPAAIILAIIFGLVTLVFTLVWSG